MLRFPFHFEISSINASLFEVGRSPSELKLNDEWKIVFISDEYPRNQFSQTFHKYLKICRQTTCGEMLVCGIFSYQSSGQAASTQEFSKLLTPGSSFVTIDLNDPPANTSIFGFQQTSHAGPSTLSGTVYIISRNGKCANDLANGECKKCTQLKSLVQLSNDFEQLLDPQKFCYDDVNLKCGDVLIPAHKIILSTRSPIFAAMFANEMKEKHENQVNITDMDASVVRAMMVYIYTGKTSSLTVSLAADLLFAADKYQLEDLKRVCCDFLKDNVSLQNALRILVLGDLHAEDLKSFAMDYICNKCADFSVFENSEEWKTLRKERVDLAMDILTSLVKARDRKGSHAS